MYLTALAGNMTLDKLEQPDKTTERYKMNRNSIIEFGRRYGSAFNYAPTFKFVLGNFIFMELIMHIIAYFYFIYYKSNLMSLSLCLKA